MTGRHGTSGWDDSGTAHGEALRGAPVRTPRLFVPNAGLDNVGIAIDDLHPGETIDSDGAHVSVITNVPAGHKIALCDIAEGAAVFKLGQEIGRAAAGIPAGSHVHVHNLALAPVESLPSSALAARSRPVAPWSPPVSPTRDHFLGYRRLDGRVATRNYLGILPSVNCAATVARLVAQAATGRLVGVPGLDGVVALNHDLGCAMAAGTTGDEILRRTLRGYAIHPNLAAVLVISLGCEVNQPENFLTGAALDVEQMSIQESGGSAATVAGALAWVEKMSERFAHVDRESIPLHELTLGLQCGGSDAASGVTANPTLGVASDLLVASGGRVVLGETPEIYGAEHLLRERAASPEIATRIDKLIEWWLEYAASNGVELDSNPSKGNRDGGITTIWEKSLGAILKGGTSPIQAVVDYAQAVTADGLTFMDTPGYDPVSATGMVAGGANVLAFTTGRGSVFGSRPVPCLKISSTTQLYERMLGDIDFDAGSALTRELQIEAGVRLFEKIVDMASGMLTKSELMGFGAEEIAPWKVGAVL
jgi:altronate hydrolase